jgi:hypothetical protein
MPALKIDDPDLAMKVATAIVELTRAKQAEERGWGYAYLKAWLPDNFGIPCAKQAKQAAVFKALVDLRIIKALRKGKKGQATRWALGTRVSARLDGDESQDHAVPTAQSTENLTWMIEESWRWSPWDDLEGEGGEEKRRRGLLLCVPLLTRLNAFFVSITKLRRPTPPRSQAPTRYGE